MIKTTRDGLRLHGLVAGQQLLGETIALQRQVAVATHAAEEFAVLDTGAQRMSMPFFRSSVVARRCQDKLKRRRIGIEGSSSQDTP
jgi:hypothetical protein